MTISAGIACLPLRRAFDRRTRPFEPAMCYWGQAPSFLAPVADLGVGQVPPKTAEPVPWGPHAALATRLSGFETNRH